MSDHRHEAQPELPQGISTSARTHAASVAESSEDPWVTQLIRAFEDLWLPHLIREAASHADPDMPPEPIVEE